MHSSCASGPRCSSRTWNHPDSGVITGMLRRSSLYKRLRQRVVVDAAGDIAVRPNMVPIVMTCKAETVARTPWRRAAWLLDAGQHKTLLEHQTTLSLTAMLTVRSARCSMSHTAGLQLVGIRNISTDCTLARCPITGNISACSWG